MAGKFYPSFEKMFSEIKYSKKLSYTPEQLVDEFEKYIKDLSENEMEVETEYRKQGRKAGANEDSKDIQVRKEKLHRAPKITDFVIRWLGKQMSWWNMIEKGTHGKKFAQVKAIITQYCYDVKFDGAVCGVFNPVIIARDLGLKDSIHVETKNTDKEMSLEEINAEIDRLAKFDK